MTTAAHDTPMMRQYLRLKSEVPDALLFYRMGDFYELFFDDAKQAATALELTLTSRNSKDPDPIPMCGVPHHAADGYLRKLVSQGVKVAIAEQVEPPPGTKRTLMERELVRVVTPGVPYDSDQIDAREACYLLGLVGPGPWGVAFLEVSTGELRVTEVDSLELAMREMARLEPREVLLPDHLSDDPILSDALHHVSVTAVEAAWFDEASARRNLNELLGTHDLTGFGCDQHSQALRAAGALVSYVRDTARVPLTHVNSLVPYSVQGHMVIDPTTRTNLELFRPLRGTGRKGTLVHLMDRTCTPMGGRRLREWLSQPLIDPDMIEERQNKVEALLDGATRQRIRRQLQAVADLERLGTKAAQGSGNPRDLCALGRSLAALPSVVEAVRELAPFRAGAPSDVLDDVTRTIQERLTDEPPTSVTDGNIFRRGVDSRLDELIVLSTEAKTAIAAIETREREATGISSLKVKHNRVFGYFLEVTQANLEKVPASWHRKQTLANAERFITPELKEFEEKVLGADEQRKALEYEMFCSLRDAVGQQFERIRSLASWVAEIDTLASFADLAVDKRYVRPEVHTGVRVELIGCRHPVVECGDLDEPFVPNDIVLDENRRLIILTGPNMAGKSTVMRQVAIAVLMAQVGAFVPAASATIGITDRLFVRVGASDDLARGRSTFMVEMSETALILNQASRHSLVLLDEIGRGTSTLDGLAIAWSVAEAMHDRIQARTIFATHYHELVSLADERAAAVNMHVGVREWGDRVVFLRTLRDGGASKSYGIQCARLAGIPDRVVGRASALLKELEAQKARGQGPQLSLFAANSDSVDSVEEDSAPDVVRGALVAVDPDRLTPKEALDLIYQLKEMVKP